MDDLPFSQACENNKSFILETLKPFLEDRKHVLEIASGTGQHATHFAQHMPWLAWQPTELNHNLPFLVPRCSAYAGDNVLPPIAVDVMDDPWRTAIAETMFTANSLHIMPFEAVESLFAMLATQAPAAMKLAVYGPFNYGGRYTSESNKRFDGWLAQQNPQSAIRDFEAVDALATAAGFQLVDDVAMPANNRLLLWHKG